MLSTSRSNQWRIIEKFFVYGDMRACVNANPSFLHIQQCVQLTETLMLTVHWKRALQFFPGKFSEIFNCYQKRSLDYKTVTMVKH